MRFHPRDGLGRGVSPVSAARVTLRRVP
jgi:hypothetical protein